MLLTLLCTGTLCGRLNKKTMNRLFVALVQKNSVACRQSRFLSNSVVSLHEISKLAVVGILQFEGELMQVTQLRNLGST